MLNSNESISTGDSVKLNSIEEAIAEIKAGRVVIVVDDENRENEGDFLTAARNMTPELVNFMATKELTIKKLLI